MLVAADIHYQLFEATILWTMNACLKIISHYRAEDAPFVS
jgi:hypothetical protein